MPTYKFILIEEYSKVVEIEAESRDEAFEILDGKCAEGEINANEGDYSYSREIYDD